MIDRDWRRALGAVLRQRRTDAGIGVREMARRCGLKGPAYISLCETGSSKASEWLIAAYEIELGLPKGTIVSEAESRFPFGSNRPSYTSERFAEWYSISISVQLFSYPWHRKPNLEFRVDITPLKRLDPGSPSFGVMGSDAAELHIEDTSRSPRSLAVVRDKLPLPRFDITLGPYGLTLHEHEVCELKMSHSTLFRRQIFVYPVIGTRISRLKFCRGYWSPPLRISSIGLDLELNYTRPGNPLPFLHVDVQPPSIGPKIRGTPIEPVPVDGTEIVYEDLAYGRAYGIEWDLDEESAMDRYFGKK